MIPQLASIAAILTSTLIFLVGSGLLNTLIPVRAHLDGFSTFSIGLIGSAYFAGFVVGCVKGPAWLARVGHIRTFTVCAGLAAAITLMQSMLVGVVYWIATRALFGFAAAALYMALESWLNDRADNQTRGRIFASYMSVNFGGTLIGQLLFATARPQSFTLFSLSAIFIALSLVPVGLTGLPQPPRAPVPRLRPLRLFAVSPVGFAGCLVVGLANSAIWTLAPVYALSLGLSSGAIALFMGAFTVGGTLVQVPIGRLSDRVDRRVIIALVCAGAAAAAVAIALFARPPHILWAMAGFGVLMLPLYGLSVAHANDRIPRQAFVETSATLLLVNALASVAGPTAAALAMDMFGARALFFYTAAIHLTMTVFTLVRLRMAPVAEHREKFAPLPQQASPGAIDLDPRKNKPV
jgi:MFS family permease